MKKIFCLTIVFVLFSSICLAGEWNLTGPLNQGRESFPSVIFNNGNVLVAGGIGSPFAVLSSCEIYDASTGIWSLTDSMTFVRRDFPLVKFRHNSLEKILVAGGTQSLVGEIFDPQSQMWEDTGSMHYWRLEAPAIAFPDPNNSENDLILFVGGDCENDYTTCEVYNPATGSFMLTGSLLEGKCGSRLVYNSELDVIMAIGGWGSNGMVPYHDCEIYDIATGVWTQTEPTDNPRDRHTTIYNEKNATVLVIGSSYSPHNSCEIYDFQTEEWIFADSLEIGRTNHCSEKLLNNKILVMGGHSDQIGTDMTCEIYDYEINEWQTAASFNASYYNFSSEILNDERVLVMKSCSELYTWNYQPNADPPQGPTQGDIGEILTFSVTASDPDNDSVAIRIDWGDNETSEWTELQPSDTTFELSHAWLEPGQYEVRAQTADQWYFLNEECHNSISEWSEPLIVIISDSTSVNPVLNDSMPIISIYPNPFNSQTTISFSNQQSAINNQQFSISIFNIKGQVIKTWSFNQTTHEVVWNGRDNNGKKAGSGIYFYKLEVNKSTVDVKKCILLK